MKRFAKFKDKLSDALYYPSVADSCGAEQEESTEVWLRRHNFPPLSKKPLIKRIAHFFLCHRIDIVGQYAGHERINWGETILAWAVISIVILLCVLARINPLPPEAYPQPHPIP